VQTCPVEEHNSLHQSWASPQVQFGILHTKLSPSPVVRRALKTGLKSFDNFANGHSDFTEVCQVLHTLNVRPISVVTFIRIAVQP